MHCCLCKKLSNTLTLSSRISHLCADALTCFPLSRYLKEFRTEQCPLFVQHKCTQHRPFSCFHWHFLNQRRRRPIRRRDGTFNYSPDVYCTKYDEGTGTCPDGDEWVQLRFQFCTRLLHVMFAPQYTLTCYTFDKEEVLLLLLHWIA